MIKKKPRVSGCLDLCSIPVRPIEKITQPIERNFQPIENFVRSIKVLKELVLKVFVSSIAGLIDRDFFIASSTPSSINLDCDNSFFDEFFGNRSKLLKRFCT